jgi:hypothetical protein
MEQEQQQPIRDSRKTRSEASIELWLSRRAGTQATTARQKPSPSLSAFVIRGLVILGGSRFAPVLQRLRDEPPGIAPSVPQPLDGNLDVRHNRPAQLLGFGTITGPTLCGAWD